MTDVKKPHVKTAEKKTDKKPSKTVVKLKEKTKFTAQHPAGKSATSAEQAKLLNDASRILAQHGGHESNIPITHEYWALMNQYRSMLRA